MSFSTELELKRGYGCEWAEYTNANCNCVELRITGGAISVGRTFHTKILSQSTVAMNTFSGVLKDQNANAETSSNAKLS